MIFRTNSNGEPVYSIPRIREIWPLLYECSDLVGDERVLYEALSTSSYEIDSAMVKHKGKLAKKLGWTVQRLLAVGDSLWVDWILPNLENKAE